MSPSSIVWTLLTAKHKQGSDNSPLVSPGTAGSTYVHIYMHTKMHSFEPFQKSFSTKLFDGRELQKQKCAAPPADSSLNCDIPAPISNPKQQSNLNIDHSPQSARSGPAPTGDREQVPLRCPVINCKLKWNVNNRSRFM